MPRLRIVLIAVVALAVSLVVLIGLPESQFVTVTQTTSAFRPRGDGGTEIGSRSLHTHEDGWGLFGYFITRKQMCEDIFADGSHIVLPWTDSRHFEAGPALVTVLFLGLIWLCAGACMRPTSGMSAAARWDG